MAWKAAGLKSQEECHGVADTTSTVTKDTVYLTLPLVSTSVALLTGSGKLLLLPSLVTTVVVTVVTTAARGLIAIISGGASGVGVICRDRSGGWRSGESLKLGFLVKKLLMNLR